MQDWKDALSALTGVERPEEKTTLTAPERKRREGVVYSTNPDFQYTEATAPEAVTLPAAQQRLRIGMERAGRGGKTVTIVRGFVGSVADLQDLARRLKQRCGVGGAAKDGEIIIQGDHRQRLVDILRAEGFSQTK